MVLKPVANGFNENQQLKINNGEKPSSLLTNKWFKTCNLMVYFWRLYQMGVDVVRSQLYQISDIKYHIYRIRYQVSDIEYQISSIRYQVSDIKYQISSFRYYVSGIKYQISDIEYQISNIWQYLTISQPMCWIYQYIAILKLFHSASFFSMSES